MAIPLGVLRQIRIEKQHRHNEARGAAHIVLPGAQRHATAFQRDVRARRKFAKEPTNAPRTRLFRLPAGGIEPLAKITEPVHQRDTDHRRLQIGGGFQEIAREHAESTAVGGDLGR